MVYYPLRIIYHLLTGRAQAQLYYIVVLVELTLLTSFLMKALDSIKRSSLILLITPIYLLLCSGYRYATGAEMNWIGRDFCAWLIFYYVGMLIRHYRWRKRNESLLIVMCILSLLVSIGEGFIVNSKLGMFSMAIGQINVTTMLYSLMVIALIMNSHHQVQLQKKYVRLLVYIGNLSFGIYFCHTFVLRCITFILGRIDFMDVSPLPLIQIVQFSLTIALSIIGIRVLQRLDTKRRLCSLIGF